MAHPADVLPEREEIVVRGSKLTFRQAGLRDAEHSAVVFLHGLGGSSATWRRQYAAMGMTRRVVGWDMPGYGGSDLLPDMAQARDYAEILSAFLAALDIAKVHLVGQSVAALIAATFARTSPGRLRSLVFAHPLTGFGALSAGARVEATEQRILSFEKLGSRGFAQTRAPKLLAPRADLALVEDVVATMAEVPVAAYRQAVTMMQAIDLLAASDGIGTPILVVAGSDDPLAPLEICRGLAAALPNARTALMDGCGHYAALERPQTFNRKLERFFEEVEAGHANLTQG